jgi:hypothetical protein
VTPANRPVIKMHVNRQASGVKCIGTVIPDPD